MKRHIILITCILAVLGASSCSKQNYIYLQDMQLGVGYPYDDNYEAVVQKDDRLKISVSSKNPELAIPFNIQGGSFEVGADGSVKTDRNSSVADQGYRVDANGNIDFPILGLLHVEGLKVSEAKELIKDRIEEGGYINNPLVSIEFLNFRYTVLGAVGHTGTFTMEGDRVTLLEAIAKAGDLSARASIDRVAVIREEGGERQIYMHDLSSRSVFDSPCFYLKQNDIVYVEPRYRTKSNEDRGWQIATTVLSVISSATSIIWAVSLLSN